MNPRGQVPTDEDRTRLTALLGRLGVDPPLVQSSAWIVRARAAANDEQMSAVYAQLNRDLSALVDNKSIGVTHITGEARVLVDPAHRRVIDANFASGVPTTVACRDSDEGIRDAESFLNAQRSHWTLLTWVDFISIVGLFAGGAAVLRVLKAPSAVHYSTFGANLILIQEPQIDETERKRVWYIQSADLVRLLTLTTNDHLARSRQIPSTSFASLLQWLYSERIYPLVSQKVPASSILPEMTPDELKRLKRIGVIDVDDSGVAYVRLGSDLGSISNQPLTEPGFPATAILADASPEHGPTPASRQARDVYLKKVASAIQDGDRRVLIFGPSEKSGLSDITNFVCSQLAEFGFDPSTPDEVATVDFELDRAMQFPYVVALVASVGSAAETLALLNRMSRQGPGMSGTVPPSVLIIVPRPHGGHFFARAVQDEFDVRVVECQVFDKGSEVLAREVLRGVGRMVLARAGTVEQRARASVDFQADDQIRRAAVGSGTGLRAWQQNINANQGAPESLSDLQR